MTTLVARLRGGFLGDVLKLSFGTLAGRLISLAALPVVTRLYSPEDFALLAVYLALVGPLAVAACLRLEIAIPLVETDREAADLLTLALALLALVTALLMLPALLMPGQVASALGAPALAPYLWLVPLGVVMAGSYSALQSWANRARRFGAISRTRVGQAAAGASATLALGWAGVAPLGLLIGVILNNGAGGISLAASALARDRAVLRALRPRKLAAAFRRNHSYPLFSTPEALINAAKYQVPVLLIAAHAGAEAGFLLLAMQVLTGPMALLGHAISQAYVARAPTEYREGRLAPFTLRIMRQLILVGGGPLLLAGAVAPFAFPWLFGVQWARTGEMIAWIMPSTVLQFISSPVSMAILVVGRQRAMLVLTLVGLVMQVGGVLCALQLDVISPVIGLATGSFVYYIVYTVFVMKAAGLDKRQGFSLLVTVFDWKVLLPVALSAAVAVLFW
jgi:O-antigen/teichoic acid export membrane protein